ncbi:MAG: DUF3231 family protein [Bacillota bacterium]|nr:DUF3231 family protein [Bacillota bacterium]
MDIKHDIEGIRLTSAEISYLWTTYIMESKCQYTSGCVIGNISDPDIKSIFQSAIEVSTRHVNEIQNIFNTVGEVQPYAFSERDINRDAPKLFSDRISLELLKAYIIFGMVSYSTALPMIARSDVKQLFTECLTTAINLCSRIDEIALHKGIFIRPPYFPVPKEVDFAHNQSILGHFIGKNRPLSCLEITHIFNVSTAMTISKALFMGLSQVVANDRLQRFLVEGNQIAEEQIETLNSILEKEGIAIPPSFNTEVLKTTHSPFSDRLSCYFTLTTIESLLSTYSAAQLVTMRKDVLASLISLSTTLKLFLKDCFDIMLDNGWYEKAPENVPPRELITH